MLRHSAFAVLLALGAFQVTTAVAADLPPEVYAPEISAGSVGQGWYMRGDLGYTGWSGNEAPSYNVVTGGGLVYSTHPFDNTRFDKHVSYGGGVGYQFNDFLRVDATADVFNTSISGLSTIGVRCSGAQPAGTNCGFTHGGDMRGIGLMGNAYADLGTVAGFTPYIGGGLGVTNVQWSSVSAKPYCVAGAANCNATNYASVGYEGQDSWRFTYALMTGFSYDLTNSMKLDLGYRYSRISGGDMYDYTAVEKAAGASGMKASDDGLSRHEIRAGIRVTTW